MSRKKSIELPEVNFSEDGDIRYLHLATEWIQGSMLIDKPYDIELEYVQRMMAWLLFVEPASVPSATTAATSGWPWPSSELIWPEVKSRIARPSASYTKLPWARSMIIGSNVPP